MSKSMAAVFKSSYLKKASRMSEQIQSKCSQLPKKKKKKVKIKTVIRTMTVTYTKTASLVRTLYASNTIHITLPSPAFG